MMRPAEACGTGRGPVASVPVGEGESDGVRDDGAGDATVGSGPREVVLNGPVSSSPPQPATSTTVPSSKARGLIPTR